VLHISKPIKVLKILKTFFVKTKTKTKTKTLGLKTKTKTLFFVLEAPRDQDFGLEDYITGFYRATLCVSAVFTVARCLSVCHVTLVKISLNFFLAR